MVRFVQVGQVVLGDRRQGSAEGTLGVDQRVVDGVLFDVDDTLVDTQSAFGAALSAVAEHYLPHLDASHHRDVLAAWRADVGGHYRRYTRGEVGYLEQRMARA